MRVSSFEVDQSAVSKHQRIETFERKIEIAKVESAIVDTQGLIKISDEGLKMSQTETEEDEFFHLTEAQKNKIRMLEDFMSRLTNRKFTFNRFISLKNKSVKARKMKPVPIATAKNAPNVASSDASGLSITISRNSSVYESSKMSFKSTGQVKTEDGRSINFDFNLTMSREYYQEHSERIQIGGKTHDPLVINLDGKGIEFGDKTLRIDLDLDGKIDEFRGFSSGSGFLALDKNGNGIIDDGSELFGPKTNNGFSELMDYDEDGNMWIDENDSIFDSLKIWTVDDAGNMELIGLKEAGLGAIFLGSVDSEYAMKEEDNLLGKIRDTSIYLREDGTPAAIHEVDLKI